MNMRCFHLFIFFFSKVSQFSLYKSFTALIMLISRHFVLFDVIINVIILVISLSDFSLFKYRNATDFCVLISYPATLMNSSTSFKNFFVKCLGFFLYKRSYHLETDNLNFFFLIWMYIFFLPNFSHQNFQYYVKEKWQKQACLSHSFFFF